VRRIIVKYTGECRKCGETLSVGAEAVYEKRVGVFCPSCAPTAHLEPIAQRLICRS